MKTRPMNPTIETATVATPSGRIFVAAQGDAVVAMTFRKDLTRVKRYLERRFPGAPLAPAPDPAGAVTALRRWLAGDAAALQGIRTRTRGTPFQETVWRALRRVPSGRTTSYSELARRIGHPTAVRAVAAANAANPVAIVIPCHRVIGVDGSLTGYAGGIACKAWLLAREAGGTAAARGAKRPARSRTPAAAARATR